MTLNQNPPMKIFCVRHWYHGCHSSQICSRSSMKLICNCRGMVLTSLKSNQQSSPSCPGLEVQRIFPRISQNLTEKLLCNFAYKFSPTNIMKTFFGVTSKKNHVFFSANLRCHFLKSNNAGRRLYSDFQGFFSDFQQIKTFGGALTPLQSHLQHHCFRNSIIGNFMAYKE